jgi:hypothetical protein
MSITIFWWFSTIIFFKYLGGTTTPGGTRIFSNTLNLLELQNIYAEMMFKYMMYRYGYKEASLRFASLIKSCIDQNLMVSGDGELEKYHQMIQSITDQTERSLTIIDELIEWLYIHILNKLFKTVDFFLVISSCFALLRSINDPDHWTN